MREILLIVNMVYDRGDPTSRANAYACMRAMVDDAAKEGYGEYRTHLLLADQVAGTYSWNNHAQMRFNETRRSTYLHHEEVHKPNVSYIFHRIDETRTTGLP